MGTGTVGFDTTALMQCLADLRPALAIAFTVGVFVGGLAIAGWLSVSNQIRLWNMRREFRSER